MVWISIALNVEGGGEHGRIEEHGEMNGEDVRREVGILKRQLRDVRAFASRKGLS